MEKIKIVKEMQSLLIMKLKYFQSFYNISMQQKKAVAQEDNKHSKKKAVQPIYNSELEGLLIKKDNIISKILELEKQIELKFQNNPSLESKLAVDSTIKSLNQQIKEVIDKTVPVEKEITTALETHKNLLKEQVRTIRKGRILITGYSGRKFIKPRFIDYKLQ